MWMFTYYFILSPILVTLLILLGLAAAYSAVLRRNSIAERLRTE